MEAKTVSNSRTKMSEMVLPNDANPLGILLGGRLIFWMDIAAEICAQMHAQNIAVTVALDHLEFRNPARIGDIIEIEAQVTNTFNTSMEIYVEAWKKSYKSLERIKINEAFFTFVVLDATGNKLRVPQIIPESGRDKTLLKEALTRRDERLGKSRVK